MADLSITAANVVPSSSAQYKDATAGETIAAGQPFYLDSADSNKAKLADATDAAKDEAVAIAVNGASAGQPIRGVYFDDDFDPGATLTKVKVYVVSPNSPGGIAPVDDLASGHYVTTLGIGKANGNMKVRINASGAQAT